MARELTGRITLKDNYSAVMEKVAKTTQKSAASSATLQKAQARLEKSMRAQDIMAQKAVKASENENRARARAEQAANRAANSRKQLAAAEKMQQAALADAEGKKGKAAEAALTRASKAGQAATAAAEQVARWEKEYERLDDAATQAGEKAATAADKAAAATKNAESQVQNLQQQMRHEISPKVRAEGALAKLKPIQTAYKKVAGKAWGIVVAAKDRAQNVLRPILNAQKQIVLKTWDITMKVKDAAGKVLKKTADALKKLAKGAVITLTVASVGLAGAGIGMVKSGMELENYEVSMQHFVERTGGANSGGGDTKAVQQALQAAGLYKGAIDGVAGKQTKAALLAYQKANGLDKSGAADPATIAKLLPNGGAQNAQATTEAFMGWLRNNANVTPFDTGEVIAAGSRAVQIAQGDTTSAQALVTLAENMAALTPGKTVGDAMEALADAQMGEMERMKEFGFKGGKKEFDAAGGDLFKMKSVNGMGLNQLFEGGAEKLGKTGSGMWSTVTGSAKSAMQEAGREMLEGLKPGIAALIPVVDQLTPHIVSFGKSIGTWIGKAVQWAITAKDRFAEWVNNNKPLIDGIKNTVRSFGMAAGAWIGRIVSKVGEIAGKIAEWVGNNQPLINSIKRALVTFGASVAARIETVISKVGEIAGAIADWVSNNKPLIDEIRSKITTFVTTANSKISGFVALIQQNMPLIQEAVGSALETAGNVLRWLWDLWQVAWPNILGFVQTAVGYMPTVFNVISAVFQGIVNTLSWLGDLFGTIWPYITSVVSWAVGFIAGAASWIIDHWNVIGPLLMGVAIAFGVVGGMILAIIGYLKIYAAVQWLMNSSIFACPIFWIILAIGLLIGGLILLAQNWDSVKNAMMNGWDAVQNFIDNVLLTMLNTMPDWLIRLFGGNAGDLKVQIEEQIEERNKERDRRNKELEENKTKQQAENGGFDTSQVEGWQKDMEKAMSGMPDSSQKDANPVPDAVYDPMAEYKRQMGLSQDAMGATPSTVQAGAYSPARGAPTMPAINTTAPTMDTTANSAVTQAADTANSAMAGLTDAASKVGAECPTYMAEASAATQAAATSTATHSASGAAAMRSSAARMASAMARASGSLTGAADRIRSMVSSVVSMMSQARSALSNIRVTVNVSGGGNQGPPLAKGMNYVPRDEFPAVLHKGEAVLPKDDAAQWRRGQGGGNVTVQNQIQVIRQGRSEDDETFAQRVAAIIAQKTEEAKYNLVPNPA